MDNRSDYEHSCPNHGPAYDCGVVQALRERIAELEKVAEAAEIDIRRKNGKGWVSAEEAGVWKALRAAGYLGGGE